MKTIHKSPNNVLLREFIKDQFDLFLVYRAANKHGQAVKQLNKLYTIFEQIPDAVLYNPNRITNRKVFWRKGN